MEVKTASVSINTAEFLLESGFNQTTVAASPCAIVFMRNLMTNSEAIVKNIQFSQLENDLTLHLKYPVFMAGKCSDMSQKIFGLLPQRRLENVLKT